MLKILTAFREEQIHIALRFCDYLGTLDSMLPVLLASSDTNQTSGTSFLMEIVNSFAYMERSSKAKLKAIAT